MNVGFNSSAAEDYYEECPDKRELIKQFDELLYKYHRHCDDNNNVLNEHYDLIFEMAKFIKDNDFDEGAFIILPYYDDYKCEIRRNNSYEDVSNICVLDDHFTDRYYGEYKRREDPNRIKPTKSKHGYKSIGDIIAEFEELDS